MRDLAPYVSDRKKDRQKERTDRLFNERRIVMLERSLSTWGMEFDRLPVGEGVVIHMLLFKKKEGERGREMEREREREGERERERENDIRSCTFGKRERERERERAGVRVDHLLVKEIERDGTSTFYLLLKDCERRSCTFRKDVNPRCLPISFLHT